MPERLMNTYARLPLMFERGEGAWLWDTHGERYLDALSGIAVCALGHAHPAVTDAVCQQAGRLVHTSNLYGVQRQQQLAERLTALSGMDKVFFCNSGAEANEAAIKLARLYGHQQGVEVPQVVVFEGSFHGRTLATLSATGNRRIQAGFEPLVQGFVRARYDDLESLRAVARNSRDVVAVLVEPIQGEGGVRTPADDYLAEVRKLCDEHGWLLMVDEIQTGMGRTGDWFAFQHAGIVPDIITLAKALGNGVPIGACLAHGKLADVFQPGSHGSTFGGNPLACSAGLAVLDTLEGQQLPQRARQLGERMLGAFQERLRNLPGVVRIRGKGLMLGIELDRPCSPLVAKALEQRLLINVTAETTIRLLPPLIISDQQSEQIVDTVSALIAEFLQG